MEVPGPQTSSKPGETAVKWQLCYDVTAKMWWMVSVEVAAAGGRGGPGGDLASGASWVLPMGPSCVGSGVETTQGICGDTGLTVEGLEAFLWPPDREGPRCACQWPARTPGWWLSGQTRGPRVGRAKLLWPQGRDEEFGCRAASRGPQSRVGREEALGWGAVWLRSSPFPSLGLSHREVALPEAWFMWPP